MADAAQQAEFRELMSLFATGVCVIAFNREEGDADGAVSAMTINSLVSVSLDPLLLCWSLQNSASQYDEYHGAERFTFSILADGQQALARRYAARGDSALSADDFEKTANGLPIIKGALATFECQRWNRYPAGDHTMILGEVQAMSRNGGNTPALGFFEGRFCAVSS
ncbi:flavin reductase family protein [Erythrobacter crassostreae]|uniref:Flavin reductase family protein n=1 Tax=Erythrobacter crassostreae TaxID=2828328 RepID=A0A9X1F2H9_9SPHN|nr:flavin reductase family protein [Erythrobacter crassostrea]MBV7258944.1 flavin reductase family protein [Erythrobacter crassostrea]